MWANNGYFVIDVVVSLSRFHDWKRLIELFILSFQDTGNVCVIFDIYAVFICVVDTTYNVPRSGGSMCIIYGDNTGAWGGTPIVSVYLRGLLIQTLPALYTFYNGANTLES